ARYAEKAGWNLDLSWVHDSLLPAKWDGDGILCIAGVNASIDRKVLHYHKPTVNIGNEHEFPAPRVAADMDKVVKLAIEHFTQRGFKHLAYYIRLGTKPELAKCRVFESGAAAAGVTFHAINCSSGRDRERLRQLSRQIARLPKPLAATAQMDEFAVELIQAGQIAGLRVPEDLAVL
ncbi:xylose operon regulatory protein, partial [mine drainage metagenome]